MLFMSEGRNCCVLLVMSLWLSGFVRAEVSVPVIYRSIAESNNVPADILYCIAIQESKRVDKNGYPWSWTMNIQGKSYYYDSKREAYAAFQEAKRRTELIDVGAMQINWRWNKSYFDRETEIFDPVTNLNVGAKILRQRYEETKDWWVAVGKYHSPGGSEKQRHAADYYSSSVRKICSKVDDSKVQIF